MVPSSVSADSLRRSVSGLWRSPETFARANSTSFDSPSRLPLPHHRWSYHKCHNWSCVQDCRLQNACLCCISLGSWSVIYRLYNILHKNTCNIVTSQSNMDQHCHVDTKGIYSQVVYIKEGLIHHLQQAPGLTLKQGYHSPDYKYSTHGIVYMYC